MMTRNGRVLPVLPIHANTVLCVSARSPMGGGRNGMGPGADWA